MNTPAGRIDEWTIPPSELVLEFEDYRLMVKRRLLLKGSRRVPLAGRPLSILIVLAERLGEVVSRRELESLLWPNTYVAEGTLRVHINTVQKALGVAQNGLRFIENLPRVGYRVAVPVRWWIAEAPTTVMSLGVEPLIPASASPMSRKFESPLIGRKDCIAKVVASLRRRRLVTLTGEGGIGKTVLAVEIARELVASYPDGVWVVDLAAVGAAAEVAEAVAATLGIVPSASDPLTAVLAFLKESVSLLVLDNCEHVLGGAAQLAQAVVRCAGRVCVLATSREHLHAEGEWIYRLKPLEVPAPPGPWTRDQLLSASAVVLFTTRAAAVTDIQFSAEQLCVVAQLCRRLAGNPLGIEIATARLDLLGLPGLTAALEAGHSLGVVGHRTRVARHWTLRAALDWSYGLLSPLEQRLFRRLGVFCGSFDLTAAAEIMFEGRPVETGSVFEGLLSLTSKSMLSHEQSGDRIRYRLHETSRTYALDKLRECGEVTAVHHRHVPMGYCSGAQMISSPLQEGVGCPTVFGCHVEDLRSALHPCFREGSQQLLEQFDSGSIVD